MSRTPIDLKTALERLILGELRAPDAVEMAREAGYGSFADLCEAELPERVGRVRIDRAAVREQVQRALDGAMPLGDLRAWAEEVATILDRHELDVSVIERNRLSEALALVAVATDTRIFSNPRPVLHVLGAIARSLGRRRAGNVAPLYGHLFMDQPALHLSVRHEDEGELEDADEDDRLAPPAGAPPEEPGTPSFLSSLGLDRLELDLGLDPEHGAARRWGGGEEDEAASAGPARCVDVVALSRPWVAGSRLVDYEWVVAFNVTTRSLVLEHAVPGAAAHGFLERARELAPNFDLARLRPEARRDHDGVLEIVLDVEAIGPAEVAYAAKLFALVHRVGRVWLDGRRLPTMAPAARPAAP